MTADEYQRTAKALAREMKMSDASVARIERELLGATTDRKPEAARHSRRFLAAAALIALIAGSVAVSKLASTINMTTARQAVVERPSPVADVALPAPGKAASTATKAPARPNRPPNRAQTGRAVSPNGFVALPGAGELPAFESGEIVRVEVPVASLPAYGVDISNGANRSVEADVLVGQDGVARAVRLVKNTVRSTQ